MNDDRYFQGAPVTAHETATPPVPGPHSTTALGARLRTIRTSRRLSLSEVALATGISQSFLSLVENGKSDITIGRLSRLAEFYKVSFMDVIPVPETSDAQIVRTHEQRLIHSPAEGIDIFLLTVDTKRTMMPMIVAFEPGAELAEFGRHEGEEFVHVIEGSMILEIADMEPRTLRAGDSAYYSAERPHLFRNASAEDPARIICVDSPPNA
jgi:transcriptional regulator with XRE-family HTH domain